MKKVIAAAAGLMLAGTMVTSAVAAEAGVKFSGDARARYYFEDSYNGSDDLDTKWNSRVRLKFKATTKGGAYAVARLRMAEATWDGTSGTRDKDGATNLYADYGYIGVPFGPVTVEAGLMPRNLTKFFDWDSRVDGIQGIYKNGNTKVIGFFEKLDEDNVDTIRNNVIVAGPTTIDQGTTTTFGEDDDRDRYGIMLNQKFDGGWSLTAVGRYTNDARMDQTTETFDVITSTVIASTTTSVESEGFDGTILVTGKIGEASLAGELAYRESDLQGSVDDGIGGYLNGSLPVGAINIGAWLGFTSDGFTADKGDFGPFIMLGGVSQISTGEVIGSRGDTVWAALTADAKVSEKVSIGGVFGYQDTDLEDTKWELGATATYAVTDGAKLKAIVGFLDDDAETDESFGAGLSLEIKF